LRTNRKESQKEKKKEKKKAQMNRGSISVVARKMANMDSFRLQIIPYSQV